MADIQELFSCLNEIQSKLDDNKGREDVQFLKQLFHNSDFQQALSLHNQVAQVHQRDPLPLPETTNAELLAAEVILFPFVFHFGFKLMYRHHAFMMGIRRCGCLGMCDANRFTLRLSQ